MGVLNRVIAQSAEMGALSTLYAATQPGLEGGTYIGPDGFLEQRGHPKRVWPNRAAQDENVARRLWEVSEQMTAVSFDRAGAAEASRGSAALVGEAAPDRGRRRAAVRPVVQLDPHDPLHPLEPAPIACDEAQRRAVAV